METAARKNKLFLYKKQTGSMDFSILLVVTILCAFGLVMVFSASYYYAIHTQNGDGYYYLRKQLIYMAIGYPLMLVVSRVNYRYLDKLRYMFLIVSIVLLIMVLFIGSSGETGAATLNGAKRWLRFAGVSIQPSEIAKFGMIFFMCSYMARHKDDMRTFTLGLAPMLLVIGVIAGLIMLQPNMSMAVIVAGIGAILLYVGGMDERYILIVGAVGIVLFIVLATTASYRLARLTSFRDPFQDPRQQLPEDAVHDLRRVGLHLRHHLRGVRHGGRRHRDPALRLDRLPGHAGGHEVPEPVREFDGRRYLHRVRPAGVHQHRRGHGPRAHHGSAPALHLGGGLVAAGVHGVHGHLAQHQPGRGYLKQSTRSAPFPHILGYASRRRGPMAKLIIEGGRALKGQITVQGAKNAALPILAAAMLIPEPVRIGNCPRLTDVEHMAGLLRALGCRADWTGDGLMVDAGCARTAALPEDLAGSIRSSVFLLGPLLGRFGAAEAPYPGGCDIGNRPVDLHLKGLRAMGVKVDEASGRIRCLGRPRGTEIALEYPSVGATENLLMAACGAEEDTILVNPAREPEIDDLMAFLNGAGFDLRREGSSRIRVRGGRRGHGTAHAILPDRIEAGTYLTAAAITGGHLVLRGARKEHLSALLTALREAGCRIRSEGTDLDIEGPERPRELRRLVTLPYPGFPTDMQSQVFALCTVARGTSVLEENVFEDRFRHGAELVRMGADCFIRGRSAVIRGVKSLHGATVTARDLRGGAALALAGLRAEGITVVEQAERIDRGYVDFAATLRQAGAAIRREDD